MVLPDSTYFPDPFTADEKSVRRLVRRMKSHAGMGDVPIKVRVLGAENLHGDDHKAHAGAGGCHSDSSEERSSPHDTASSAEASHSSAGNCASGSCGNCGTISESDMTDPRLVDLGEEWLIQIPASEIGHDVVLTTNIAKSLGLIFARHTSRGGKGRGTHRHILRNCWYSSWIWSSLTGRFLFIFKKLWRPQNREDYGIGLRRTSHLDGSVCSTRQAQVPCIETPSWYDSSIGVP